MKIMSDTMDSIDTEDQDTEEDRIYSRRTRGLKSRNLRSVNTREKDQSNSVRRSTRNKSQTYDNLNASWIFGTHTLKGYPTYKQQDSSSDKEVMNDREGRRLRSVRRTNQFSSSRSPPKHISRSQKEHGHSSRELIGGMKGKPRLRDRNTLQHTVLKNLRDRHSKSEVETGVKDEQEDSQEVKTEASSKVDNKESQNIKTEDLPRLRERRSTRFSSSFNEKDKPKAEEDGEEEEEEEEDDASSEQDEETDKPDNNDNSDNGDFQGDMYSRVKRTRRASQRKLPKRLNIGGSDSSDDTNHGPNGPRKYSLRKKKPAVDRFQASQEQPVQRSIRVFRSCRRMRRKRLKSSSSSSSSSDSERYDKKKSKKTKQSANPQGGSSDKRADISPITVDGSISFENVGGLESHIHCLKEMVVFPMMYPDVFERFHTTPPKGVLFHGPPGTGKTLIARALANECSQGNRKVSFFMRKGADCLSKWVGESERQLRLLFEQAQQMKPSIIFFDEIDGLAPVRSTKQDQIHASIVSTLLALMDGLSDRGEVVVIGATNRVDAIDPALRRPGRFDRELLFPLPGTKERLDILKIHTSKWEIPPEQELLEALAEKSTGYSGSDLRALCTEAVIQGLKRRYPQIYRTNKRLLLNPKAVEVTKVDFSRAGSLLIPSSQRVNPYAGKKLPPFMEPLLGTALKDLVDSIKQIFPQGVSPAMAKFKTTRGIHRPRLLITSDEYSQGHGPRLAQALIHRMEHLPVQTLDVSTLFAQSARSPEETCVQVFTEAARNVPSVIYIRAIDQWWSLVPETVKAVFLCRVASLDPNTPIMILATSEVDYEDLPPQIATLFSKLQGSIYLPPKSTEEQRRNFFKPVFLNQCLKSPTILSNRPEALEDLPIAPDLPRKLTEEQKKALQEKEEISLRELRIFLREICQKLARNRQFFMFTRPVDTEEVPDYKEIIAQPMDLETMMTKIDFHHYLCARDFLDDIDLICCNALEYNPDRDPADKLIRHRACFLRDTAYALIKAELDSDFEEKCREISKKRREPEKPEGDEQATPSNNAQGASEKNGKRDSGAAGGPPTVNGRRLPSSRKRRVPAWARGYVKNNQAKKRKKITFEDTQGEPTKSSNSAAESPNESEKLNESLPNGHVTTQDMDENSESEQESLKESAQSSPTKDKSMEVEIPERVSGPAQVSESSHNKNNDSFNVDDLLLDMDSDSSLTNEASECSDKVIIINKIELEDALDYTVKATENFSVELLCDLYVQLARCAGKFSRTLNRKELPKLLLNQVKLYEEHGSAQTKVQNLCNGDIDGES